MTDEINDLFITVRLRGTEKDLQNFEKIHKEFNRLKTLDENVKRLIETLSDNDDYISMALAQGSCTIEDIRDLLKSLYKTNQD